MVVEGYAAFAQRDDARKPTRDLHVVQVDQEGRALTVQVLERIQDTLGRNRVHGGEGFVGQDHVRPLHQQPRDGHPLLLANREVRRPHAGLVPKPNLFQRCPGSL